MTDPEPPVEDPGTDPDGDALADEPVDVVDSKAPNPRGGQHA